MPEIIYNYTPSAPRPAAPSAEIRWLAETDCALYNSHLALCGQRPLSEELWREIYADGTRYCGLFIGEQMTSRACIEKLSEELWEISDVRTAQDYRGRGQAYAVCDFVLRHILAEGKTPSIRTEEHNIAMQKVIAKLGFVAE